jgi:hypothetical protein
MTDATTISTTIPGNDLERDPQPFGPPSGKPATRSACRVTSVRPYPSTVGPEGFQTVVTICMETPNGNFDMSIDARSANFLAAAVLLYAKPFQSFNKTGTSSFEAANPSA